MALYQWMVTQGKQNPTLAHLLHTGWPALSYANDAQLTACAHGNLFSSPLSVGIAQLETMASCPFRHFVKYGLKLQAREKTAVSGLDLSQVYHRLLDKLLSQIIAARSENPDVPFSISPQAIHQAAAEVARALRGELMLSTARNRYLLLRVEQTVSDILASQEAAASRYHYRLIRAGISFGGSGAIPPLHIATPRGAEVWVSGRIDRIDALPGTDDAIAFDYRLGASTLSMMRVYHGLSLQLVTYLLVLQGSGEQISGRLLVPVAAFYLKLLRFFEDVDHPDDAMDPSDERYLLGIKPRGLFHARAMGDLDSECQKGPALTVQAFIKEDGTFGHRKTTDVVEGDEFLALSAHVHRRIGELADNILTGNIAIAPYWLARAIPLPGVRISGRLSI